MANPEILYPAIRRRTREALRNLFDILNIEGEDFDGQLFELAAKAFAANATPPKGNAMIKRARSKQPRRKIEIKQSTADDLRNMHNRLFPYLPWQSWNWYMQKVLEILEESLHESKDDYELHDHREREY